MVFEATSITHKIAIINSVLNDNIKYFLNKCILIITYGTVTGISLASTQRLCNFVYRAVHNCTQSRFQSPNNIQY